MEWAVTLGSTRKEGIHLLTEALLTLEPRLEGRQETKALSDQHVDLVCFVQNTNSMHQV